MIGEACGICQNELNETNCSICIRCVEITEESKWAPSLSPEVHQRMVDVLGGTSPILATTMGKSSTIYGSHPRY